MLKRWISLTLVVSLVVSAIPSGVFADGNESGNRQAGQQTPSDVPADLQNIDPSQATPLISHFKIGEGSEAVDLLFTSPENPEQEQATTNFLAQDLARAKKQNERVSLKLVFPKEENETISAEEAAPIVDQISKVVGADETTKAVSKPTLPKRWSNSIKEFQRKHKEDPSRIYYTLARGVANGVGFWTLLHFRHVPASVAITTAATVGMMSGSIQFFSKYYLGWLTNNKRVDVQFAKSYMIELAFDLVIKTLLAVHGYNSDHGIYFLENLSVSAFFSELPQFPAVLSMAYVEKRLEQDPSYTPRQVRHIVRSGLLAISVTSVGIAIFQMMHIPYTQYGVWALSAPAWFYYGHFSGWNGEIKNKFDLWLAKAREGSKRVWTNVRCRLDLDSF